MSLSVGSAARMATVGWLISLQTDFQTNEIRELASITKGLNLGGAQSLSFIDSGVNLITDYTTPEGQMVLAISRPT